MRRPEVAAGDPHQLRARGRARSTSPCATTIWHKPVLARRTRPGDGGAVREDDGPLERGLGAGEVAEEEQPPSAVVERDALLGDLLRAGAGWPVLPRSARTHRRRRPASRPWPPRHTGIGLGPARRPPVADSARSRSCRPSVRWVWCSQNQPRRPVRASSSPPTIAWARSSARRSSPISRFEGIRLLVAILFPSGERAGGERRPVANVALRDRLLLARRPELDPTVLADRVQQAEPAPAVGANRAECERPVREPDDASTASMSSSPHTASTAAGGTAVANVGHPPQDDLVGGVQQLVAPVERRAQRPVARDRRATAVGRGAGTGRPAGRGRRRARAPATARPPSRSRAAARRAAGRSAPSRQDRRRSRLDPAARGPPGRGAVGRRPASVRSHPGAQGRPPMPSGASRHRTSLPSRSGSRLVARIDRAGEPTRSASASRAHGSITCSQLSRISRRGSSPMPSMIESRIAVLGLLDDPEAGRRPRAAGARRPGPASDR